jgi:hypothetical protein
MLSKLLIICWICCNKLKELIYSYRAWQDKEAFSLCYAKIPSGAFKILSKNRWNDNGKKTVWSLDHCFCVLWPWALGSGLWWDITILQFWIIRCSIRWTVHCNWYAPYDLHRTVPRILPFVSWWRLLWVLFLFMRGVRYSSALYDASQSQRWCILEGERISDGFWIQFGPMRDESYWIFKFNNWYDF